MVVPIAGRGLTRTGGQGSRCLGIISGFVLKLARQSAGVTQERFAEILDADVTTVQGWESGRRSLTAMQTGEFVRIRSALTRCGAPASIWRHLHQAIEADLVLAAAVDAGNRWIGHEQHPLAASVHRRALTNLIAWPVTGVLPSTLKALAPKTRRRGPVAAAPVLHSDERTRFFEHLLTVVEQGTRPEHALLRRQAVYLLRFDTSGQSAEWLNGEWRRATKQPPADGDLTGLLEARSASIALASVGHRDVLQDFVAMLPGDRAEAANLNYWAYWIGEVADDQADDEFMRTVDPRSWGGIELLRHLTNRLDPASGHLPLNLQTLYTLVASRPSILADWPQVRAPLSEAIDRASADDHPTRTERDQLAGLHYALRIADR